jgi:2-methylisocitrate lyase-like PEP mutase family enzyme
MVIYANLSLRAAIKAAFDVLISLKKEGSSLNVTDKIITMDERNKLTRLHELTELEKKYGIRGK